MASTVAWALLASAPLATEAQAPPPPGVLVETVEKSYRLDERSLEAVVDRLNSTRLEGPNGPPSQGLTTYRIQPEWRATASGGSCRVSRITVHVEIEITLPEWRWAETVSLEDREKWATIDRAIREHEYRHRDLTVDAAADLLDSLQGLEARGCTTLRRVVNSQVSVADGRLSEAHAQLDRETKRVLRLGGSASLQPAG